MKHLKQKLALLTCFVTLCATLTSCNNSTENNTTEMTTIPSRLFEEWNFNGFYNRN